MKLISFIVGAFALLSCVAAAPAPRHEVNGEDVCGPKYGKCGTGECCSRYGYCGKSSRHCDISRGCQSEFGICNGEVKAMSSSSSSSKSKSSTSSSPSPSPVSSSSSTSSRSVEPKADGNVEYAGFRFSVYGAKESFKYVPEPEDVKNYVNQIKNKFYNGTKGTLFLIVGVDSKSKKVVFQFPKPSNRYSNKYYEDLDKIEFIDSDRYENILQKCDEENYHVWLQVEPGENDLVQLAHIVMDRYGHHPSVRGFGIDLEWWYRNYEGEGRGKPISNENAEKVVKAVRERNSSYSVYVKHWRIDYMPSSYRDGLIFVNDSQEFSSLSSMKKEFQKWAAAFPENPVFYQIGYKDDRKIWEDDPISVAKAVADDASKYNDEIGIVWVDFTMKQALEEM